MAFYIEVVRSHEPTHQKQLSVYGPAESEERCRVKLIERGWLSQPAADVYEWTQGGVVYEKSSQGMDYRARIVELPDRDIFEGLP